MTNNAYFDKQCILWNDIQCILWNDKQCILWNDIYNALLELRMTNNAFGMTFTMEYKQCDTMVRSHTMKYMLAITC